MYHEWECPDCGHELHHECETAEGAVPQEDSEYCGDPDDPLCGPDMGKPWCAYHGGTEVPQRDSEIFRIDLGDRINRRYAERDIFRIIGVASATKTTNAKAFNDPTVECCGRDAADCDCPPEVPCLCQGLTHYEGCPNWELPD